MKKIILVAIFAAISSLVMFSQTPPPPPNDPSNGGTTGPVGGGAPVGSGIVVLIALSAGYAGKKVYNFMNNNEINAVNYKEKL